MSAFDWFKPAMWLLEISLWLPVRLMQSLSGSSVLNVYGYIVFSKRIINTKLHQGFFGVKNFASNIFVWFLTFCYWLLYLTSYSIFCYIKCFSQEKYLKQHEIYKTCWLVHQNISAWYLMDVTGFVRKKLLNFKYIRMQLVINEWYMYSHDRLINWLITGNSVSVVFQSFH